MHWRRFPVKDIPIADPAEFEVWLRERWSEKDILLEYYMENGCFPEDDELQPNDQPENTGPRKRVTIGKQERTVKVKGGTNQDGKWEGPVETEVRIARLADVLSIFTVLLLVSPVYYYLAFLELFVRSLMKIGILLRILK